MGSGTFNAPRAALAESVWEQRPSLKNAPHAQPTCWPVILTRWGPRVPGTSHILVSPRSSTSLALLVFPCEYLCQKFCSLLPINHRHAVPSDSTPAFATKPVVWTKLVVTSSVSSTTRAANRDAVPTNISASCSVFQTKGSKVATTTALSATLVATLVFP